MKSFLIKKLLLVTILVLILVPVVWRFDAGYLDNHYTRLTTDRAPSLIIGTSRAAQGLQPRIFNDLAPQMQNFAFTLLHSPFGPAYLELIEKKVLKDAKEGLFIIAVDPWSISSLTKEESGTGNFRENNVFTSKIHFVDVNPNIEYILRFYDKPFYYVFAEELYYMLTKASPSTKLHKDGWLEVNIPVDSATVQKRIYDKTKDYQRYVKEASIHPIRLGALAKIIELLDKHGDVFLVRLPVSKEIADIEREYSPNFDKMMQGIAAKHNVDYINYFNDSGRYLTTDGNHLSSKAGRTISLRLSSDIKQLGQGG